MSRSASQSKANGFTPVHQEIPVEAEENAKPLFADLKHDYRSIVLWLCFIHQKLSTEHFGSPLAPAPERNVSKGLRLEKLERGIRFLVMRTLASKHGPLSKSRERLIFVETVMLFFATKEQLLQKVAAQAASDYMRSRGEIYLDSVSYAQIARTSLHSGAGNDFRSLSEIEADQIQDFLNSFGDLRDYLIEATHHCYKDTLLKVCWLRHGPLGLVIIGTLSAFLVPLIAWNFQANDGFKHFVLGWLSFLVEHFR